MEAEIDLFNLRALLFGHEPGGLGGLFFFLFNPCQHFVRPIRPKRIRFKEGCDFRVQVFFADVGLGAPLRPVLLGATIVGVAFLDFAGHTACRNRTAKKADERLSARFVSVGE